jgi:formylglycine-generating enzyme required for sulfatase activity
MMETRNPVKAFIFFSQLMLASISPFANNISVSNISLTGQNVAEHYTMVKFDISWENSWRTSSSPGNWDAAWIFIKYRIGTGVWLHAWLNNTGHINPAGSSIATGLLKPDSAFSADANPGLGVFIYRDTDGAGTFFKAGVQLRWNHGANGVDDNETVDIRVYAIELVYVPQGEFYAGSGGTETSAFYKYPVTTNPYPVSGEGEITVGTQNDNLYYSNSTFGGDQLGPIPASFPKGYNAFYCMKYEISQQGYVDFLNSLTQIQANKRKYTGSAHRYAIMGSVAGSYSTTNPDVACNNLNWADITAYFDWSGLRPLTELEFEKACRGTTLPMPNEYAWGTAGISVDSYTLSNTGAHDENIAANYNTVTGNAAYNSTTPHNGSINGPVRTGIFAGNVSNTGRVTAGASYYGIMEMSGNLLEHFVTAGNPAGRAFTGMHGNGTLNASGDEDVANWPGISSIGAGFRGGYWSYYAWYLRVSERSGAAGTDASRYDSDGGRGGRTAPLF